MFVLYGKRLNLRIKMRKNKWRTEKARAARYRNEDELYKGVDLEESSKKISAESIVASSIYTGVPFKPLTDAYKIAGIETESIRKCYMVQKKAAPKIISKTDDCIQRACQNFSGTLQLDTRWSHARNGTQGLTTAIDPVTRKVVGRSHQVKSGGMRFGGNFTKPPNMMETYGSTNILSDFQNRGLLQRIETVTRDRDNKSEAIFEKFGIADKQRHDPGHFRKNFHTLFSSFTSRAVIPTVTGPDGKQKPLGRPFYCLATSLEKWLNSCFQEKNDETRVKMWLNSAEHFTGNHSQCQHPPTTDCFVWKNGQNYPLLKQQFVNFLNELAPIIRRISNKTSTQNVESMNAEYAKSLSKQLAWKYAQPRLDAAILKHNEPESALEIIADCCGAELSQKTLDYFSEAAKEKIAKNEKRRTPEARKLKNQKRMEVRRSNKSNEKEGYIAKKAKSEE